MVKVMVPALISLLNYVQSKSSFYNYADPRLSAFVTHGGLGSVTELAHMGKPAILIPIYGDQTRNARMLAKHGGGIVLTKFDLETPTALRDSLNIILKDASYASNAKRLSEMLVGRPISSKSLLISHCEFAAKFGRLPNLDPFGRHLSYMEYFLIDIAIVSIGILALAAFVVVIVVRKCLSFTVKRKKD